LAHDSIARSTTKAMTSAVIRQTSRITLALIAAPVRQSFGDSREKNGAAPARPIIISTLLRRLGRVASAMTWLVNEQNIRTHQRLENRACNDPGILTTDMKALSCGLPSMRVMCLEYSIRN
jgi:hypothetical protein